MIICRRCSIEAEPHHSNPHLCDACVKAEDNRVAFYRNQNFNWMEVSKDAGLEVWERQPAETDLEYSVWLAYRDAYPGRKPSYRQVAEDLGTTINAVKKVGSRWDFPARLQAWAKYVDDLTLAQRRREILAMNERHVSMAETLSKKLQKAIDNLDPYSMSPREINSMMKTMAELERKARLDTVATEQGNMVALASDENNPNLKKADVKADSINEVLEILGKAGVLSNIGVRQTVTTEVVVTDGENVPGVRGKQVVDVLSQERT